MTVSQEMREWAMQPECWFCDLSDEAFKTMRSVGRVNHFLMYRASESHRRTFALLVACALEDES